MLPLIAAFSILAQTGAPGSVIFIHPDGSGLNSWHALRLLDKGPDGQLNWDRMERVAIYHGHARNALTTSSNGGASAHAYGVPTTTAAFGLDGGRQLVSASGRPYSLMRQAKNAGLAIGVINSASITDAGTGVFLASVASRGNHTEIASQMLAADPEVILGGGEQWFLPTGKRGVHGEGRRTDGRDLIAEAENKGYRVVRTRDELLALPAGTKKVLGLFSADDTFNDVSEERLRELGQPPYNAIAPSVGEMLKVGLRVMTANNKRFFLVLEEEGSDNFPGENNAKGTLEALRRADNAIGVAMEHIRTQPRTLLVTAADGMAGGMQVMGAWVELPPDQPIPAREEESGTPMDGRDGTATPPFLAAPDRAGNRLPFAILWTAKADLSGSVIARAHGYRSNLMGTNVHSTDIFRIMHTVLFGAAPRR